MRRRPLVEDSEPTRGNSTFPPCADEQSTSPTAPVVTPARSCLLVLGVLLTGVGCGDHAADVAAVETVTRDAEAGRDAARDSMRPDSSSLAGHDDVVAAGPLPRPADALPPDRRGRQARPADSAAAAAAHLALEGEGLRVFFAESGSSRPIPFGTPAAAALETVERVLGHPPVEQGASPDCGGEYARWRGGLSVRTARNRFVGWSLSGDSATLTTAAGVGIGSTRTEFEEAYVLSVRRSTIGLEFSAGALAGVLDAEAPDGRITHMWAGEACIAR